MRTTHRLASLLVFLAAGLLIAAPARADLTRWKVVWGDWSETANWTNGEPTADTDAESTEGGTIAVTRDGEICRSLSVGLGSKHAYLRIDSGSLTVVDRLSIGPLGMTTVNHDGGTITAADIRVGSSQNLGMYLMTGGSLVAGSMRVGNADGGLWSTCSMASGNPEVTVAGTLSIDRPSSFTCQSGTLKVGGDGSGGIVVGGTLGLSGAPTIAVETLAMGPDASFFITAIPQGIPVVQVAGVATIDGKLTLLDNGAPDGTYEILTAEKISGAFTTISLPEAWGLQFADSTAILAVKGEVPVERVTWGSLKAGAGR